jgi:leader peptidase (prepilin peptidase)/N-methyltransferase
LGSLSLPLRFVLYLAAMLAGLGLGMAVNLLADAVEGDEEPPWRAATCAKCGVPLPASRLMPIANVWAARRRCPDCGTTASLRRPALELALAALLPLLLAHVTAPENAARLAPWAIFLIDAAGCVALAFVFAVDLEHHLILDIALYPAAAVLLAVALLFDHKAFAGMLFGVVLCGGLFLLFYVLGFLLYHQEALGFGDVTLAVLVGLLVGWPGVITALVLAALFGAAVSVLLLGMGTATRHTFIPYGVFLAGGTALTLLLVVPFW